MQMVVEQLGEQGSKAAVTVHSVRVKTNEAAKQSAWRREKRCGVLHSSQPARKMDSAADACRCLSSFREPPGHTQFVLTSLLYSGSKGSSGDVGSSLSLHTRVRTLAPRPGDTGMDWLLPVVGQLGPTRS